jgi:hypothetical protein
VPGLLGIKNSLGEGEVTLVFAGFLALAYVGIMAYERPHAKPMT